MVHTFVTIAPNERGYQDSAHTLDFKRLLKQCVEASQILSAITDLALVASLLNIPRTENNTWIKTTYSTYKKLSYKYVIINGGLYTINKDDCGLFDVSKSGGYKLGKNISINGDKVIVQLTNKDSKKYNLSGLCEFNRLSIVIRELGDHIITLGWVNHPALKMWIGYEAALALYINDHMTVFQERNNGKGMDMPRPQISTPIIHPWWLLQTDKVILSHRAALLRKEIFRKEPPNYIHQSIFVDLPDDVRNSGYIWVSTLSADQISHLIHNTAPFHTFAAPVNNDIIDISCNSPAYLQHLKSTYPPKHITLKIIPNS